jgi:cell division protein FtsB
VSDAATPTSSGPRFTADQVRRRRAIAMRATVATIVVIGLLFVVVFPVQAWMRQRADLRTSQHRLTVIRQERQRLEREAKRLQDPQEVERIAREMYGMVRPGEQAYAAVPGTTTTTTTAAPAASSTP